MTPCRRATLDPIRAGYGFCSWIGAHLSWQWARDVERVLLTRDGREGTTFHVVLPAVP